MAKVVPIVAFFVALVLGSLAVPAALETIQMSRDIDSFRSTRALVVQRNEQTHDKGPKTQVVRFQYKVDTRKFDGNNRHTQFSDSAEDLDRLVRKEKDGKETILIYYDPQKPSRSAIRKDISTVFPWSIIGITALLSIASVASFISNRRHAAVMRRFEKRA